MRKVINLCALAVAAVFSSAASGAMLQTDDFQSGTTEGWTDGVFMSPMLQATGGPAGLDDAFLLVSSMSPTGPGSKISTFNTSPNWVGDFSSLDARSVTVDLMNPIGSSELEMRLVLFGPADVNQRWTSTLSAVVPNDGVWRNFEFSLAEENLTRVLGTSSYLDLVGNVLRVMLRHDPGLPSGTGDEVDASLGIDNVSLIGSPPTLPADFDGDGDVDAADFDKWKGDFGGSGSDADEDGDSDGADFLVWQQQFNDVGASGSISVSQIVPEPSVLALLGGGLLFGAVAQQRRCVA